MRVGQQMKLIDLDASVSFTSGTEFSGVKFSSGYLCPELIYCTSTVVCVKTKSVEYADKNGPHLFDLVKASKAHDLWSLGVVIYNIATNAPLFLCDGDGNIDDTDLRLLAEWRDSVKLEKLLKVKNIMARNLISLLLSKDPNKRPSVQHVMVHPFLTGKRVSKAVGEVAQFDVFLSYRIDSDLRHVELLYKMLTEAGVTVWWDKICLKSGESGDVGFCVGLMRSKVFMPIISQKAIGRFSDLTRDSPCDNLLLEFILALEFKERGCIDKIFPIFIGEKNEFTDEYCKYSFTGVNPDHPQNLPNLSVDCVEAKLMVRIDDIGLGLPFTEAIAVDNTVAAILKYQGNFVEGELVESFQAIISHALPMFSNNRGVIQSLLEED
jgi:serine/threonine protein kinase